MIEIRLRTRANPADIEAMVGKIPTPHAYDVLLTGATKVVKPDGSPLCVYLPGAIPNAVAQPTYPILHSIRGVSDNRGAASGSLPVMDRKQQRYKPVMSNIIGSYERTSGRYRYCRLTAWTVKELERFRELTPLFQCIAAHLHLHVPDRYAAQLGKAKQTHPDWLIPGTPFTTITVNNTYPTGVHVDDGDLKEGFSCLATLRRGDYVGGQLLPTWRVAVDMRDGDLLLMDAHEYHGNVKIEKRSPDAERISVVCYYRTKMTDCGSLEQEKNRALMGAK